MPNKYYTEDDHNDIPFDYWNAFLTGGIVTALTLLSFVIILLWVRGLLPFPAATSPDPILPSTPDPTEYRVPPCGVLDSVPATFEVETFAF